MYGQESRRRLSIGESEAEERKQDDWNELRKAAAEKHPELGSKKIVLPPKDSAMDNEPRIVDYDKLTRTQRNLLVTGAFETEDQDAFRFLTKIKERMERVGVQAPTVEVRWQNLHVEAKVLVGERGLPNVINSYRNFAEGILVKLKLLKSEKRKFVILDSLSGYLPSNRICLLLGPPGSGKSTLLQALAGKLQHAPDLKVTGEITYNGHTLKEFVPQRTSAYVNQYDEHMAELTVRETLDFSRRVQGAGNRSEELKELREKEKEQGVEPDPEIDAFMKANTIQGKRESIETEYVMHVLGLKICSETKIGSQMIRGISGGQKKRVTTGEMISGPKRTLFMDEISTGLDSSTTFQIVRSLRDFVQQGSATAMIALLQPAPEVFDLFDDVMLLSEGHILYHGPREQIMRFFQGLGFDKPERKGIPDFLQEVSGLKDQEQYWTGNGTYRPVSVQEFAEKFKEFQVGRATADHLKKPYDKSTSHPRALIKTNYALPNWKQFKALFRREETLIRRTIFIYFMKTFQVALMGAISATLFLRTQLHPYTLQDAQKYAAFMFFSLLIMLFNGIAEMSIAVERFPVYFKQRDNLFYTAASFCLPATIMRIPYSLVEAIVWTGITYFPIGLAGNPGRFFFFLFLLFLTHQWSVALFRMMGALCRNIVVANAIGIMTMLFVVLMGGFVIPKPTVRPWSIWLYWASPLMYAQRAMMINEFTDGRWQNKFVAANQLFPERQSMGNRLLTQYGLPDHYWWCWIGVGVLILSAFAFNVILVWAHQYLGDVDSAKPVMSEDQLLERDEAIFGDKAKHIQEQQERGDTVLNVDGIQERSQHAQSDSSGPKTVARRSETGGPNVEIRPSTRSLPSERSLSRTRTGPKSRRSLSLGRSGRGSSRHLAEGKGLELPFEPMTLTFEDLHYFVDLPPQQADSANAVTGEGGKKELELLRGISGAFRPKKLTALMGVTGAGKTTLMDVLAGRKTGGRITGDVRINGFPKEQQTFARVSGYVEQNDIHQPFTTVYEALLFSARLRFPGNMDADTIEKFVAEVCGLVELTSLADALVGRPGRSGLSVEQRKRLTIAVELVANPSIIFMDEPTSGLDARAAAIVMRTVRNIVDTGRTITATIHQPSIDIFEAFDELVLLKRGGETIYCGPLGQHSSELIGYFSNINGVPPIKEGLNPATWMLEVSTPGAEQRTGVDFAKEYRNSKFARDYDRVIKNNAEPREGSKKLEFSSQYAQPLWSQYKINLWRFRQTYWRTTEYSAVRYVLTVLIGAAVGFVFWKLGGHVTTQLGLTASLGALYASSTFIGIINSVVLQPIADENRGIMYRERAAGMYAILPWYGAMMTLELLYGTIQAILFVCIVYFACGFSRDASKFFWFLLYLWQLLIFFTLFGMAVVALTPNIKVSAVISSNFYSRFNLFAGFIITLPACAGWWVWMLYISPCFWCLWGLVSSQVGNFYNDLITNDGSVTTPAAFAEEVFGFKHKYLGWIALIQFGWIGTLFVVSYLSFKYTNYLKR